MILVSIMILLFAGLLIIFPPIGTIIAIVIFIVVVVLNIHMLSLRISLKEGVLRKESLFTTREIDITKFSEFTSMKIIGTVANSPLLIRYVNFRIAENTVQLNTFVFRWQEVLDLIEYIETEYGEMSKTNFR